MDKPQWCDDVAARRHSLLSAAAVQVRPPRSSDQQPRRRPGGRRSRGFALEQGAGDAAACPRREMRKKRQRLKWIAATAVDRGFEVRAAALVQSDCLKKPGRGRGSIF